MAALSIELFDKTSGKMAEDVEIQVRKVEDDGWKELAPASTDKNGKAILAAGKELTDGSYFEVLVFLGNYFDITGRMLPQYKMVDIVPLRFGIESASHDITLKIEASPYSYSANFSTQIKRLNLV